MHLLAVINAFILTYNTNKTKSEVHGRCKFIKTGVHVDRFCAKKRDNLMTKICDKKQL